MLRHSLVLAYDGAPWWEVHARALWESTREDLEQRGLTVAVVDFAGAGEDADILAWLSSLADGVDVIFVIGLEELLVTNDDRPRPTAAVATLNFNRDLLRDRLTLPIVLWLSERAARAFAMLASDTFDILRTTFEFPKDERPEAGEPSPEPEPEPSLTSTSRTSSVRSADA